MIKAVNKNAKALLLLSFFQSYALLYIRRHLPNYPTSTYLLQNNNLICMDTRTPADIRHNNMNQQ